MVLLNDVETLVSKDSPGCTKCAERMHKASNIGIDSSACISPYCTEWYKSQDSTACFDLDSKGIPERVCARLLVINGIRIRRIARALGCATREPLLTEDCPASLGHDNGQGGRA